MKKGVNTALYSGNVGSRFEDSDIDGRDPRFSFDICGDRRDDKTWVTINVFHVETILDLRNRFRDGTFSQGSYVVATGSLMKWKRGLAIRVESLVLSEKAG